MKRKLSASAIIRRIAALGRRPAAEPTTFRGRAMDVKHTITNYGRSFVVMDVEHDGGKTEVYMNEHEYAAVARALAHAAYLAFAPKPPPAEDSLDVPEMLADDAWDRRN